MAGHWSIPYIGRPWVSGGRGPDDFDCWGLVCEVYKTHLGVELPLHIGVDAHSVLAVSKHMMQHEQDFTQVMVPAEFDIVSMGRAQHHNHIGLWTQEQGGGIVHCQEGIGVVFSTRAAIKAQRFNNLRFFRHDTKSSPHQRPIQQKN